MVIYNDSIWNNEHGKSDFDLITGKIDQCFNETL